MLVNNFLEESARKYPDKTALVTACGRYAYREIDEMANKIAYALVKDKLEKGDRVAILMDNSLEAVAGMFGVLKADGIFVMVNPSTKKEKLTYIMNNCRASGLISSQMKMPVIRDACNNTPSLRFVYLDGETTSNTRSFLKNKTSLNDIYKCGSCEPPVSHTIDIDLANIVYTSGSTGIPKGVMMTHLSMISAATSIIQYLENSEKDIILNTLPMSFDYGLYQILMGFKVGATIVLEKTFLYPYKIIDTILKEKITGFPIVPTIAAILLQMDDIRKHRYEHLRYISNTAASLPVAHIQKLRECFPDTKIYSMYGLTECKRATYLLPDQIDIRPTSVGKGMPNTEAYIVDEKGNRVDHNVVGELVVRGSNVMSGYWEMPEETAKRLRPGKHPGEKVLYTGDLFKMDEDGYLYFMGRMDDVIKSRGEKVSPREIENVLYEIDGVIEAAVVGVDDSLLGEALKAFIVTRDGVGLTEKKVKKFCAQHLEDFMVPKYVEFCNELPRTESGKICKQQLQ